MDIRTFISGLSRVTADCFAPFYCISCLKFGRSYLCASCADAIQPLDYPLCPVCLKVFWTTAKRTVCSEHRVRTSLDGLYAAAFYEGIARDLTHYLKFTKVRAMSCDVATIMARTLSPWRSAFNRFAITPVPLGRNRLRERGYNQVGIIADELSRYLGLSISNCLSRTRETKPQTLTESPAERIENLRGCFAAQNPPERVLLLDDVRTTGTTLEEAAATLKRAGARRVIGVVFALTKK